MKKVTFSTFILLTLLFCFQNTLAQCTCKIQYKNLTTEKAFNLADFVFTGKIVSTKRIQDKKDKDKYKVINEFEVYRVWKGSFVGKIKKVNFGEFNVGTEWLIYASIEGDDLSAHFGCCSQTGKLAESSDAIKFFDEFKKNQEGEVLPSEETNKISPKKSLMTTGDSKKWQIKYVGGIIPREFYGKPIFVTEDAVLQNTEIKEIDGVKVTVNTYEYKKLKRLYDEVQTCNEKRDNLSLAYNEFDYGFENYETYSVNGKVFGYYLNYWIFESDDNKYEIGVGYANIYLQRKENDIFKIECANNAELDSVTELNTIPSWIKNLSKNK